MKKINEESIGRILGNMELILDNMSRDGMKDNPRVVHYVGMNYRLHLTRLQEEGMNNTALLYAQRWTELTGRPLHD